MTEEEGFEEEGAEAEEVGFGNFEDLFAQLEQATQRLESAAGDARSVVVRGSSAGGAVEVGISGELEALSVHIDPSLVDASDIPMLEDAVLAAIRDALAQVVEMQQEVADLLPDGGVDLSGLLSSLGGMFGNLGGTGGIGNVGALGHLPGGSDLAGGLGALLSGLGGPGALMGHGHPGDPADGDPADGDPADGDPEDDDSEDEETDDEA